MRKNIEDGDGQLANWSLLCVVIKRRQDGLVGVRLHVTSVLLPSSCWICRRDRANPCRWAWLNKTVLAQRSSRSGRLGLPRVYL
jgi:hypothetical protein